MTRPSASGLRFLVRRSDCGKFSYWRNVPAELAVRIKGEVALPWSLKRCVLDGQRVIKISLKTGDVTLAQRRWGEVHRQIEAIIETAIAKANQPRQPILEKTPSLTSGDRAAIAAQARHDVMADHDAGWTEPDRFAPLASGLASALGLRDSGALPPKRLDDPGRESGVILTLADVNDVLSRFPRGASPQEIREAAREMEAEEVRRMLKSGESSPLDCPPTVMEEIELDPNAPGGGRIVGRQEIPGELTARLAENGLELSDEVERRKLAHAVLTAKAAAFQDIARREMGMVIETPPRPAPLACPSDTEVFPSLLEMHEIWVKSVTPDRKRKDDNKLYVDRFVSMHGDLPVDRIKRKHVRDFRDKLKLFPVNMPTDIAKKSFLDIVAWAEKNDPPRLSPVTVNAKGLGSLSTLLQLAVKEYDLPDGDPSAGLRLAVGKQDVLDRHPFTPALLERLAGSPVFSSAGGKVSRGGCGAAAYWIPLISLYSGARLEEIGQLLLSDIICQSGVTFFWFRDDDEEDEIASSPAKKRKRRRSEGKSEEQKSIKSDAGRRRVPMHRVLIELGLPEYIAARRAAGDKMLFPQLTQYRGRWTKNWSRWWARYQDQYLTEDPAFVFHSFRHSFIGAMRRQQIPIDHMKTLVGHARELNLGRRDSDDVTEQYGEATPIAILDSSVQKVEYSTLKFAKKDEFLK